MSICEECVFTVHVCVNESTFGGCELQSACCPCLSQHCALVPTLKLRLVSRVKGVSARVCLRERQKGRERLQNRSLVNSEFNIKRSEPLEPAVYVNRTMI